MVIQCNYTVIPLVPVNRECTLKIITNNEKNLLTDGACSHLAFYSL